MPSTLNSSAGSRERTETNAAGSRAPEKENLQRRREDLIRYFRGFMEETFEKLGVASEAETGSLRQGLLHIGLGEREISDWERYRDTTAEWQLFSARSLSRELDGLLARARDPKLPFISRESEKRWRDRFHDRSLNYKAKEYFVQHQMPAYLRSWEKEAQKRWALLKHPQLKSLTKENVKELGTFIEGKAFLSLHFEERADLNAKISAALSAKERRLMHLHAKAKAMLEAAATAKAMSPWKVGRWMERIFVGTKKGKPFSEKEIENFLDTKLRGFIGNWAKVRTKFDWVEAEMKRKGVPQGFNRLTPEKFMLLSYPQKKSYTETAKQRLKLKQGQSTPEMENTKISIRHMLDIKDWEEADDLIKNARSLLATGKGKEQDRFELDSMERYLKAFREREREEQQPMKDARQTLEQMRTAFAQIPSALQPLYLSAMQNESTFDALRACTYNRIWCREHGHLDDDREKRLEARATTETQRLAATGVHKKKGLENIKLGSVTDTKHNPAVRTYGEGEWGPTIIHMPPGTDGTFLNIIESRKGNGKFRYWTTLIPTGVSYEKQEHIVKNVNWVLKSGMKKLKECGLRFTLTGNPIGVN